MIWQTTNFAGGMNDFLSPHLLQENTLALVQNATVDNGKISPVSRSIEFDGGKDHIPDDLGEYNCLERSSVTWNDCPIWSDNATGLYGTVDQKWGGPGVAWDRTMGDALGIPFATYDGSGGINPVFNVSSIAEGETGLAEGKYRYCITFVNWRGYEGAPGSLDSFWKDVEIPAGGGKVTISIDGDSIPRNVWYAKVYRTIEGGADFYYAFDLYHWRNGDYEQPSLPSGTADNNWQHTDILEDYILLMKSPLLTSNLYAYPPPGGGKYLCESNGVFYLAVGSSLYFSNQNNPHGWPADNFIGFNGAIKGITTDHNGGVLVFGENNVYRVSGAESQETVIKMEIPGKCGLVSYKSISSIANNVIWLSREGIIVWDGNNISNISFRKINIPKSVEVKSSCSYEEKYYLLFSDGNAIVYDSRAGGIFYKIAIPGEHIWPSKTGDLLYIYRAGKIRYMKKGLMPMTWKVVTPCIGGGNLAKKRFKCIFVHCEGDIEIKLMVDGAFLKSFVSKSSGTFNLPSFSGRYIQMEIQGTGELSDLGVLFM